MSLHFVFFIRGVIAPLIVHAVNPLKFVLTGRLWILRFRQCLRMKLRGQRHSDCRLWSLTSDTVNLSNNTSLDEPWVSISRMCLTFVASISFFSIFDRRGNNRLRGIWSIKQWDSPSGHLNIPLCKELLQRPPLFRLSLGFFPAISLAVISVTRLNSHRLLDASNLWNGIIIIIHSTAPVSIQSFRELVRISKERWDKVESDWSD